MLITRAAPARIDTDMSHTPNHPPLFDRLPYGLFQPLGSHNRKSYWEIIVRLYTEYFSEEADIPELGYQRHDIVVPIERFLRDESDWQMDETDGAGNTPIAVRANNILTYLIECGWLVETTVLLRRVVEMRPGIQQFLDILINFADQGPQFLGGKVQVIYNTLLAVERDPADGAPSFHETARQAKSLVASVASTRTQVSELMKALRRHEDAGDYVAAFFDEYISRIYIADYTELRTTNHPLRRRREILAIVNRLRLDDDNSAKLLAWYEKQDWGRLTGAEAMERDFRLYGVFHRIETHLDRLNAVVVQANKQAMAYISYRIRTRADFDRVIDRSLDVLSRVPDGQELDMPFAAGPSLGDETLATPKKPRVQPRRPVLQSRQLSARQIALNRLMRDMRERRAISPGMLAGYLDSALGDADVLTNADLPIDSIRELCSFIALTRVGAAAKARAAQSGQSSDALDAFDIIISDGERVDNLYVEAPKLVIRRKESDS